MTGREIRLKQLFKTADRLLLLPMDHGITVGPIKGLENVGEVVKQVSRFIDAVVVHKGLVPQVADYLGTDGCKLMIHLSASTMMAADSNKKELVTTVEHAVRIGASAVSAHINLGSAYEAQMIRDLGMVTEACDLWGMPLLAMMYVRDGSQNSEYDSEKIKHAARVAEELGADIVKVNYTGTVESFKEVVHSVRIPVIIAGGPKISSEEDLLQMVSDALKAGAKGVAIGRNVFQHENPAELANKIRLLLDKEVY